MPNRYTGVENDPFQESQHIYTGPAWAKLIAALGDHPVRMSAPGGQIGASPSLGAMSPGYRIGDEDVQRSLAINSYLGDLQDERRVRDQSLRAMSNQNDQADAAARDRQTVERAAAIANTPGVSAHGREIVGGAGMYTTGAPDPNAPTPADRQRIAAQMAPGLIEPPKPVTYGNPETQMVDGKRTLIRLGSDGLPYDMARRPVDPTKLEPLPDKNAPPEPVDIQPNTPTFKTAQDLAYGKMTFGQFRTLVAYGRDPNLKLGIYAKAAELNPDFNPADFERGFKFMSNPKVAQQLASLDNVQAGIPDLLKASDEAARSGVPLLNKYTNPVEIALGNKKFSNFNTARTAFADELSGGLGYGSATDMSREMGFDMTDMKLSPDAFREAVQTIIVPFVDRKRASILKQGSIYGKGENNSAISPSSAKSNAPAQAGPVEGARQPIPGGGGIAEYRGGKWIRVQ